jgi:hypothetical protein
MLFTIVPKWVVETEEKLKDTIKDITLKNKLDYHLVQDSKTIEDSIKSICFALQRIPEDKDMVEAEKYFEKHGGNKNENRKICHEKKNCI